MAEHDGARMVVQGPAHDFAFVHHGPVERPARNFFEGEDLVAGVQEEHEKGHGGGNRSMIASRSATPGHQAEAQCWRQLRPSFHMREPSTSQSRIMCS